MDSALELEKLRVALQVGADTVIDLSTGGPLTEIRRSILAAFPAPVGTVPLDQVQANMQLQKRLCHGASFYVLGPLVTDVAKGVPGVRDWDDAMSRAWANLDWDKQIELTMDPARARHRREQSHPENGEVCTMCGELCAYKTYRDSRQEGDR